MTMRMFFSYPYTWEEKEDQIFFFFFTRYEQQIAFPANYFFVE